MLAFYPVRSVPLVFKTSFCLLSTTSFPFFSISCILPLSRVLFAARFLFWQSPNFKASTCPFLFLYSLSRVSPCFCNCLSALRVQSCDERKTGQRSANYLHLGGSACKSLKFNHKRTKITSSSERLLHSNHTAKGHHSIPSSWDMSKKRHLPQKSGPPHTLPARVPTPALRCHLENFNCVFLDLWYHTRYAPRRFPTLPPAESP